MIGKTLGHYHITSQISVVLNWTEQLKQVVPAESFTFKYQPQRPHRPLRIDAFDLCPSGGFKF